MDFVVESSAALQKLADYMRTIGDRDEFASCSHKYAILLRLQTEAVAAPPDLKANAEMKFRQQYAAYNPVLALSPEQQEGDEDDLPVPSAEQKEEIKKIVYAWCQLDNEEREMKTRMAAMRKILNEKHSLKAQLTETIMNFMERFNVEDFEVKNGLGLLRFNKREVKKAVTKNCIVSRLKECLDSNESSADELIQNVFKPEIVTRRSLRRLLPN